MVAVVGAVELDVAAVAAMAEREPRRESVGVRAGMKNALAGPSWDTATLPDQGQKERAVALVVVAAVN